MRTTRALAGAAVVMIGGAGCAVPPADAPARAQPAAATATVL